MQCFLFIYYGAQLRQLAQASGIFVCFSLSVIKFASNDEPLALKRMHEISAVDGFAEITSNLADMIKFLANEPSVGLFYIQQHTHNAVPNLVNLNNNVAKKSHEVTLHMEDLEDSITMMRSMKEFGFPIAEDMIKEIKHSLAVMSTNQPKKGLINAPSSSFGLGRSTSWGPSTWSLMTNSMEQQDSENISYLSNVFKSARQKASNFRWPQIETRELVQVKAEPSLSSQNQASSAADASSSSTVSKTSIDEFPLLSQTDEELHESPVNRSLSHNQLLSLSDNYEEFRANKEAKLEEWLEGTSDQQDSTE